MSNHEFRNVRYSVDYRCSGELVDLGELPESAYHAYPEFRDRDFNLYLARMTAVITEHTRVELAARTDSGLLVGGIVAGLQEDCHYGYCMTALLQYVHPSVRDTTVYRTLFRMFLQSARDTGVDVCMYTRRLGPGKYLQTYRSIKDGSSKESRRRGG